MSASDETPWYEVQVPDGLDATPVTQQILSTFWAASVSANGKRSALYMNEGLPIRYYFSPRAAILCRSLIEQFNGQPCAEPRRDQVSPVADPDNVLDFDKSQQDS